MYVVCLFACLFICMIHPEINDIPYYINQKQKSWKNVV